MTQEAPSIGKLGFGLMRLPRKRGRIDIAQTSAMVDEFLDAGFTYFDTAFIYPGSEVAIRKALVKRYPRESYYLATKVNPLAAATAQMARNQLATSLKRTEAGYIDYYLLHAIMDGTYKRYEKLGLWDFAQEQKKAGVIRHVGFSFHGGPDVLDHLLTQHPEVEFVQLQLNYADWNNPRIQSQANYEVARAHNVPIVVMEPVKGGSLADPPTAAKALFDEANPDASYVSWAIRFAAGLDGVLTVLSGMSTFDQVRDNISYMRNFQPLNESETEVVRQVQLQMGSSFYIGCTACGYCLEGCPCSIPIPDVFAAMNMHNDGHLEAAQEAYEVAVKDKGRANACVVCGACEKVCTQHLSIIKYLKEATRQFENDSA